MAAVLAAAGSLAAVPLAGAQTPGTVGIGDPYFPSAGNGGYDVGHYDLRLAFRPRSGAIRATATIDATATQALSAFNLDFGRLKVSSLAVNGAPATVRHRRGELTVTPAAPIASGAAFQVAVSYRGRGRPL